MSNKGKETDILLDHNYDGIQEYDNPLPNWWLTTFYGTIIFAIGYYAYYQLGSGPLLRQELAEELKEIKVAQGANVAAGPTGDELAKKFSDPAAIANGKVIFGEKCAMCHGPEGQGLVGPNLTDKFWINGKGHPEEIVKVITEGVPEKGMIPWGPQMSADKIIEVAAFVKSLQGTSPANPKAAEGTAAD